MKNKVTFKEEPNLFYEIEEFSIDSIRDHRKGSTFYTYDIINLKLEDKIFFPEVEDFEQYIGTWMTNTVIWDDNYGFDSPYSELTRVEKKAVTTYEWVEVK